MAGAGRLIGLAGCAALLAVTTGCRVGRSVQQPVAYPHKTHVVDQELACVDCHAGAETADHATLPEKDTCLMCHEEPLGESAEEAKLVAILNSEEPLLWHRVTRVAEHVHFSHKRHVEAGGIACETCHGEVSELVAPFTRPHIDFSGELGMERCIACHQSTGNLRATVDCLLCHR